MKHCLKPLSLVMALATLALAEGEQDVTPEITKPEVRKESTTPNIGPTKPVPQLPEDFSGVSTDEADPNTNQISVPSLLKEEGSPSAEEVEEASFQPRPHYVYNRYQSLADKTPFGKPTEDEKIAGPDPFENLFVKGFGGNEDSMMVLIETKDNTEKYRVSFNEPDRGLELVRLEPGETLVETMVTLRKGPSMGTVGFNEAKMKQNRAKALLDSTKVKAGSGGKRADNSEKEPSDKPPPPRVPRRIRLVPSQPRR